jgi:hypothetical protein
MLGTNYYFRKIISMNIFEPGQEKSCQAIKSNARLFDQLEL